MTINGQEIVEIDKISKALRYCIAIFILILFPVVVPAAVGIHIKGNSFFFLFTSRFFPSKLENEYAEMDCGGEGGGQESEALRRAEGGADDEARQQGRPTTL